MLLTFDSVGFPSQFNHWTKNADGPVKHGQNTVDPAGSWIDSVTQLTDPHDWTNARKLENKNSQTTIHKIQTHAIRPHLCPDIQAPNLFWFPVLFKNQTNISIT